METETTVALVIAASTVVAAIIAAWGTANVAAKKNTIMLAQLAIKVDTLWQIYAEDAIREARLAGMVASQSKEQPTEKWTGIVPDELAVQIEQDIIIATQYINSPYDISVEIWNKHSEELLAVSREQNVSPRGLFGTIYLMSINGVSDDAG